mmetsp:Transcript_13971/g.37274  ORF Transcript_13971/g.37274 Transcript_13971/m.37274 type:complete len:221 (+) Transcript_13971:1474-2136(+)
MLLGTLLAGTSGVSCSGARGVSMLPSCPAACLWGGDCCLGWLRCAGGFGSLRVLAVLYIREEGSDRAEGRGGGTTAAAVGAVACVDADVCPGGGQGADAKGCGAVARWPCDPPCWLTTGAPRVRALCTPLLPACCASSPLTSRRYPSWMVLVPLLLGSIPVLQSLGFLQPVLSAAGPHAPTVFCCCAVDCGWTPTAVPAPTPTSCSCCCCCCCCVPVAPP